jgi:hypothetical protein
MVSVSRYCMALFCLVLVIAIFSCGCTSSQGSTAGSSSGTGADDNGYHSSFAELAGTYVNVDNPSSSIILYPDGAARIGTGSSGTDTSVYMETGVLYLADGTSIGAYPIEDGTLTYQGSKFRKQS